jgi:phosphoribosylanthranilate isomerase
MTKIKICGLTRVADAVLAAELGADFLGFIFVPGSPRYMRPEDVAGIVDAVTWGRLPAGRRAGFQPAGTRESGRLEAGSPAGWEPAPRRPHFVGVFRDASVDEMRNVAAIAGLDYLQLHGVESDDTVRAVGKPVIKGVHVSDTLPAITTSAEWVLFDTYDPKHSGGTGRRFDWSLLAAYDRTKPFLLAGGITPDNVEAAIDAVHPDAIDLASGVESAPGIKDHTKLRMLFERVRSR